MAKIATFNHLLLKKSTNFRTFESNEMKNILQILLFILLSQTAFGQYNEYEAAEIQQADAGARTVVRVNLFGSMAGSFTGEIERVINKRFSVQLAIGYRSLNLTPLYVNTDVADHVSLHQRGFTFVPQIKYYWTHFSKKLRNPMGAYIAPYMRIGQYDFELKDDLLDGKYDLTYDLTAISGGLVFGFQLIAGKHFALDAFFGPQVKHKKVSNERWRYPSSSDDGVVTIKRSVMTFEPRVGITAGIAF